MRTLTAAVLTLSLAACSSSAPTGTAPKSPAAEVAMKAPAKQPKAKIQAAYLGIDATVVADGIRIKEVAKDSPASRAGLLPKDVILSLDGANLTKAAELRSAIRAAGPGSAVRLRVKRDGGVSEIRAVLGSRMQDADDDDDDDDEEEFDDEDDDDEDEDDDD